MAKCDFKRTKLAAAAAAPASDWKVNVGSFTANGVAHQLGSLDAAAALQRLRVSSDKCDFRVQLSPAAKTTAATPSVSAALQSAKCDFALAVLGTSGNRQALSQMRTRLASDKSDFVMQLQFGEARAPLFRVSAVASAKCDFRITQIEIREASGAMNKLNLKARPGK